MKIGIIGAGNVGFALAKSLKRIGHNVKVANSRGRDSLKKFELETGANAVDVDVIAIDVDILILAIPLSSILKLPPSLKANLSKAVAVVDTGNYIPQRDGQIAEIKNGLPETKWVAEQLGHPVIKAFNNIIASNILTGHRERQAIDRIALPVAGDDPLSVKIVLKLVEELGFTGFDAGNLSTSWRWQPGQPAYCTNPTILELPKLLARGDNIKAPVNRDKAMKLMAKLSPDYPAEDLVRISRLSIGLDTFNGKSWLAMLKLAVAVIFSKNK